MSVVVRHGEDLTSPTLGSSAQAQFQDGIPRRPDARPSRHAPSVETATTNTGNASWASFPSAPFGYISAGGPESGWGCVSQETGPFWIDAIHDGDDGKWWLC